MSNDPHNAHSDAEQEPPDRGSAGDVSTTGHSDQEVDAHDAHSGHGADDAAAEAPTIVPTTWRQLILPAVILVVVAILLIGPISNAFSPRPAPPPATEEQQTTGGEEGATTPEAEGPSPTVAPTSTPQALATAVPPTATTVAVVAVAPLVATQTAVALLGERGEVGRQPAKLEFGGASFNVSPGSGLLPDWQPNQPENSATWIEGTVANHILYLPFGPANEALFKAAKQGDIIKITMNTGQVFTFSVARSERAANRPPTAEGEFTVTAAMKQDHAGVTLFLSGDPAPDRAVVQADFTGNIQSNVLP